MAETQTFRTSGMGAGAWRTSVGIAVACAVLCVVAFVTEHPVIGVVLALVTVGFGTAIPNRKRWFAETVVEMTEHALVARSESGTLTLPWSDLRQWGFGQVLGGRYAKSDTPWLIVWPRDGVGPGEAGGQWAWEGTPGCWRVLPARSSGGIEPLAQAMARHTPEGSREDATSILG